MIRLSPAPTGAIRSRLPLRSLLSVPIMLGCLCLSALAQDKDTVQLKDGKTETGKIKSEEFAGLVMEGKTPRTIEWSQITPGGIAYGGSVQFTSAKESLDAGKYPDALTAFEGLKSEPKLRDVLKQDVLYYYATLQQRAGDWDKAIAGYTDLAAAFPKSRYLMEIGEGLVACYVAKKDTAGAQKALDGLSTAAIAAGVENGFGAGVNVIKGRLLEEQTKYAEAQAAYGVAEKAPGVPASVVQQARLGQGRCLMALGKKSEAESIFRKLVAEDAPNPVMSGAWNGLGDLLKEEGRKAPGDPEKLLDALFCYMRGVVQYAPLPGENVVEYKRALKGSEQCFKFISELEKSGDRKKLYAARAADRAAQYAKEFPGD